MTAWPSEHQSPPGGPIAPQMVDEVLAAMLFPDRPDLASVYMARHRLDQALLSGAATVQVSAEDIRVALDGPGGSSWDGWIDDAVKAGSIAGALLLVLYQMQSLGQEPSMNYAMREVYADWALGRKFGDGKAVPYSKQSLQGAWNRFAPAAHFWAAYEAAKLPQSPYPADRRDLFADVNAFRQFLGVARAIGEFAVSHVVKRTKPPRSFIDANTLIPVPGDAPPVRLVRRADLSNLR